MMSATETLLRLPFEAAAMFAPSRDLFSLGLRVRDSHEQLRLDECEFTASDYASNVWRFEHCARAPGLTVILRPRVEGGVLFLNFAVAGVPTDCALEWIEPLRLCVANPHGELLLPRHEGVLVKNPLRNYEPQEPGWHNYVFFPGYDQMQFLGYFADGAGLCYIARDRACGLKYFNIRKDDLSMELYCRVYCGRDFGQEFEAGYEFSVETCRPVWQSACARYRDWLENSGFACPKGNYPEIVKASPVVVIYPVRGRGDDRGDMGYNEYYPYLKALPVMDRLRRQLDSKLLALLMHWEGTAPWAPPYVWPPQGGEALLAEYRDALHKRGDYLGVYCSGTAWTQESCIDRSYRPAEKCATEHLEPHMVVGPDCKDLEALICSNPYGQRLGYDLCMGDAWARQTIIDEVRKLANFGLDYAQFFDQNIGGAAHPCWARNHRHAPVPGPDQVENQKSLLQELRERFPKLLLGAESGAAEPYLEYLPFSDMRYACWDMRDAHPVPAYSFIYHEYVNNFMGNQNGIDFGIDFDKQPENLLWRTAYAFASGNLLSVVLGPGGSLMWGWIIPWDTSTRPDQESELTLLRNLNAFRKQFPQFMVYGRMLEPQNEVAGPKWTLPVPWRFSRELDAFIPTWWQAPNGDKALVLTNFRPAEQVAEVDGHPIVLPPLNAVIIPLN